MSRDICTAKLNGYSETQCESLKAVAKPYSKRSKGLLYASMTNLNSGERLGTRLSIQDNGENIVLNICPFCGGELHDLSRSEVEYLRGLYTELALKKRERKQDHQS